MEPFDADADMPKFEPVVSKADRYEFGKSLRKICSREEQGIFQPNPKRDPVQIIVEGSKGRIESLLPIRYGRMIESPFAFFRGSAGVMAADLAGTPSTGLHIQICGDCHMMNFGGFASPERKMVFDINDFDETSVAPWEWDVKRLAASFVIGGRWKNFSNSECEEAAWMVANSYKIHMGQYAQMSALQVWYSHLDLEKLIRADKNKTLRKYRLKRLEKAMNRADHEKEFAKLTFQKGSRARIKDDPPLIYHAATPEEERVFFNRFENAFTDYLLSLPHERQILLSRYKLQDIAMKVVGVGSVGTFCGIALFMSATGEPLFLQFKEAFESVLEPFAGESEFDNNGQRVVVGQRLMQSASDIFLGWTKGEAGRHFYIRQLRDAKVKPILEMMEAEDFSGYARACGWALARAHARAGDASVLEGYMGSSEVFEDAITKFSVAYSDQAEQDYHALLDAVKKGKIEVRTET
ncbi:DUF2252 domain-containing protein [Flavobacterium hauense]